MERAVIHRCVQHNRRLGIGLTVSDKKTDSWICPGRYLQPTRSTTAELQPNGWRVRCARCLFADAWHDPPACRRQLPASRQQPRSAHEPAAAATRPLTQITDQRFVDTEPFRAKERRHRSASKLAGDLQEPPLRRRSAEGLDQRRIRQPQVATFDPTRTATARRQRSRTATRASGAAMPKSATTSPARPAATRAAAWDRTKVLNPFNEGGWGALQVNGRIDYLDLTRPCRTMHACRHSLLRRHIYVNGGKQLGLPGRA